MLGNEESFRAYTAILKEYLPLSGPAPLEPSDSLVDLGLDSVNTVALLVGLEEAFGAHFPDEALTGDTFATVGSLWTVLSGVPGVVAAQPVAGPDRAAPQEATPAP